MKAYVITEPHSAGIQEVPFPVAAADEVIIKVERVGICGTDFHIFSGEFLASYPIIPGHEFSGTIVEVGQHVQKFKVGDRVAAEPNYSCGHCEYCVTNRHNHCSNWEAIGITRSGAMAEYVAVPFNNVYPLPDHMSFGTGAFLEPMACVVHGLHQLSPKIGDRALLIGAGAMGQQLIKGLSRLGVSELIVVDIEPAKLELAKQNGATTTLRSDELDAYFEQPAYKRGLEIVIDVTGIPTVIQHAFNFLGCNGTFLQFGVTASDAKIEINPFDIFNKDWKIVGSKATKMTFHAALQWVGSERVEVESLVSRVVSLDELDAIFRNRLQKDDFKVQVQL